MTFLELLILISLTLFGIFLTIFFKTRGEFSEEQHRRSDFRFLIYIVIASGFLLFSLFYFLQQGSRDLIWFSLFAAISFSSLYFVGSLHSRHRFASIIIVFSLVALQVAAPTMQNQGYIYGPDEWRDLRVMTFMKQEGTFKDAPFLRGDFYSAVPLFDVENTILYTVLGCNGMLIFSLMAVLLELISSLIVFAIMMRLTESPVLAILTIILSVSMPRGSSGQYIPAVLGGTLGTILILVLVLSCERRQPKLLLIGIIAVFSGSFVHPLGMITFFALSLGILAVNRLHFAGSLPRGKLSKAFGLFAITLILSMACWSSQEVLFNGVFGPVAKFMETLARFGRSGSGYEFQYSAQGLQVYALAWSLPVAAAGAFLVYSLRDAKKYSERVDKQERKNGLARMFFVSAGAMGLILLLGGLLSIISNPGAGIERYLTGPAYGLIGFSAAFSLMTLIHARKGFAFAVLAIMMVTLIVGVSSPDNAPFEHPSFGSVRTTWQSTIEAYDFVPFLSTRMNIIGDHDTPIAYLVDWPKLRTEEYVGFEGRRKLLQSLKENSFDPTDAIYVGSIFVIKSDEIEDPNLLNNYVNLIYDSGRHRGLMMPLSER